MQIGAYPLNQVIHGDSRELSKSIPENSIDLIFTDPPYPKEFLHTYSDLSEIAARVLKPNSICFAYAGNDYLPEVMSRMSEHLTYRCTVSMLHAERQILFSSRFLAGWKPLLVYVKGSFREMPIINGVVWPSKQDKRFHFWGQNISEAIRFIEQNSEPNDIVYDPFVGGGTTPAACMVTGRNYIASEIVQEQAEICQKRLIGQQMPLMILAKPNTARTRQEQAAPEFSNFE